LASLSAGGHWAKSKMPTSHWSGAHEKEAIFICIANPTDAGGNVLATRWLPQHSVIRRVPGYLIRGIATVMP